MTMSLIFLLALLSLWVWLNRHRLGLASRPCDWSRIHERDRDGEAAWFCPSCRMETHTKDGKPPTVCGLERKTRQ